MRPNIKPSAPQKSTKPRFRQIMNKWQTGVMLDGEQPVWNRQKALASYAAHLLNESPLGVMRPGVLKHSIGINDIKG